MANYSMASAVAEVSDNVRRAMQVLQHYADDLPAENRYDLTRTSAKHIHANAVELARLAKSLEQRISKAERDYQRQIEQSLRQPYFTLQGEDVVAGDRVSAWVFTGSKNNCDINELVYLDVVRVNKTTVTVRYADGHTQRVKPEDLNRKESRDER